MRVGIKGIPGKQDGEADTATGTLKAKLGKMVSSSKGTRKVLLTVEHLPRARNAHNQRDVRRRNREGNKRVGGGECRCIRRENTVVQKDYRDSSHGKK